MALTGVQLLVIQKDYPMTYRILERRVPVSPTNRFADTLIEKIAVEMTRAEEANDIDRLITLAKDLRRRIRELTEVVDNLIPLL